MKYNRLLGFLFLIGTQAGEIACSYSTSKVPPPTAPGSTTIQTATIYELNTTMQPAALQILATHCDSCHGTENMGGLNSILDPNHLVQQGVIIPGNPAGSLLVQYVTAGLMPPSGPLAAADISTLSAWVQGTALTPTPGPTGSGTPAQQVTRILTNSCVACHGSTADGGLSNITNLSALVQNGWIVPGNAAGSPIYNQVSAGAMPPSGPLGAGDLATISSWIGSGAPAN